MFYHECQCGTTNRHNQMKRIENSIIPKHQYQQQKSSNCFFMTGIQCCYFNSSLCPDKNNLFIISKPTSYDTCLVFLKFFFTDFTPSSNNKGTDVCFVLALYMYFCHPLGTGVAGLSMVTSSEWDKAPRLSRSPDLIDISL